MSDRPHDEWMRLARRDLKAARALLATDADLAPTAAYHCQQAAEKALKAVLVAAGTRPQRTHDLRDLLEALRSRSVALVHVDAECDRLTKYVSRTRYPGDGPDVSAASAAGAIVDAQRIVRFAEDTLGDGGFPPLSRTPDVREAPAEPYSAAAMNAGLNTPVAQIVAGVVAAVRPRRVILFGSRASGHPQPDSDVDLMVELDHEADDGDVDFRIRQALGARDYGLDLLIYTPSMVAKHRGVHTSFLSEIEETGRVMYEQPVVAGRA